jgi:hypothetical protein
MSLVTSQNTSPRPQFQVQQHNSLSMYNNNSKLNLSFNHNTIRTNNSKNRDMCKILFIADQLPIKLPANKFFSLKTASWKFFYLPQSFLQYWVLCFYQLGFKWIIVISVVSFWTVLMEKIMLFVVMIMAAVIRLLHIFVCHLRCVQDLSSWDC